MATHHPFVSANSSPTSNGTPGTKLTEFSPEDFRSDAKLPHEVARAVQPPAFALQGLEEAVTVVHQGPSVLVAGLQDPFTSTPASSKIEGTRLSPRATTFKPLQASYSVPNLQSRDQGPGDAVPSSMKARGITRYLRISKVLKTSSIADLNRAFNEPTFSIPKLVIVSDLADNGVIYTRFSDIRDAQQAYKCLPQVQIGWFVKHIDLDEFIRCSSPEELGNTSFFEAQVLVTARCSGSRDNFDPSIVSNQLMTILRKFGDILSCVAEGTLFPLLSFRVEFCDSHDAEAATLELDGTRLAGLHLTTTAASVRNAYGPLIIGDDESLVEKQLAGFNLGGHSALQRVQFPLASGSAGSSYPRKIGHTLGADFVANPHPHQLQSPLHGFSIQGVSSVPLLPWGYRPGVVGQERFARARSSPVVSQQHYSPKSNNRMGPEYTSGHHNVVDVERIRQGLDVRTTIMLRNIPNKIDQAMLKEIVDETSSGKYDFMYLRIDFANNCNVGYAFINFEDPWFIIDFVKARAGRRWNRFNSDKVAEVSYATIQGKDCLVQKFRNSSVMLEHASFRPKIFHTGNGPLAGQEDTFPGPDNPSKMRRSVENAEHVGLFAPRAGQHLRDEQRRRRSQYDRGTRLAELEDALGFDDIDPQSPFDQHRLRSLSHGSHNLFGGTPSRFF